jgi:thiol-disulfide isomerase/thioredoxin
MARRSSADGWMWAIVLGAIALVVGLAIVKGRHEVSALEGKKAPSVTLQLLDGGKTVALPDKAGKVVMLDFWATWCGPCKASMPAVQRVWRDYQARGVELYAVNTDAPGANRDPAIREFLMVNRVDVPIAVDGDNSAVQAAYNVASLPTLVVLDRAGNVAWSHVGFTGGMERELRSTLDAALAARASN